MIVKDRAIQVGVVAGMRGPGDTPFGHLRPPRFSRPDPTSMDSRHRIRSCTRPATLYLYGRVISKLL